MKTLTEQTMVYVVTEERVGALGVLSIAINNLKENNNDDK